LSDTSRIERAELLLKNELFIEAFDVLETELRTRWENSGSTEVDARESCWLAIQLLQQVRRHIESIVTTGKMDELTHRLAP